jgi:hypothetical protein
MTEKKKCTHPSIILQNLNLKVVAVIYNFLTIIKKFRLVLTVRSLGHLSILRMFSFFFWLSLNMTQ